MRGCARRPAPGTILTLSLTLSLTLPLTATLALALPLALPLPLTRCARGPAGTIPWSSTLGTTREASTTTWRRPCAHRRRTRRPRASATRRVATARMRWGPRAAARKRRVTLTLTPTLTLTLARGAAGDAARGRPQISPLHLLTSPHISQAMQREVDWLALRLKLHGALCFTLTLTLTLTLTPTPTPTLTRCGARCSAGCSYGRVSFSCTWWGGGEVSPTPTPNPYP